jgi:hypothetical protein
MKEKVGFRVLAFGGRLGAAKQIPRFPTPSRENRARWGPGCGRNDNIFLRKDGFDGA